MDKIATLKLIAAIILGYAVLFFTMWLFRHKKAKPEAKK